MALPHAVPGEIVDVQPLGTALTSTQTTTLFRAGQLEVIRLVIPARKEIPPHKAKGEIVVQCLEGRVAFTAFGKTQNLETGQLLYLRTGEAHPLRSIDDASLLLTVILPKTSVATEKESGRQSLQRTRDRWQSSLSASD